jgi:hypothetical protein
VLDGHAAEVAEIAADGTWLRHGSQYTTPTISGRHVRPVLAWHLKDLPTDHEHVRPVDPWPRPAGTETFPPG